MKKIQQLSIFVPFILLICVAGFFFYKTVLFNLIPFPGDLLVSEYQPWRGQSFLGFNPGSIPQKFQYFDVVRQLYPWKTIVLEMLKTYSVPLWNPYNFSGSPLLANTQSAIFYPLNSLYLLFSQSLAWTLLVILQPLLASFFTYLYCRKLSLSKTASLISSISFAYSLYTTVFLEYNTIGQVILWLPLALFSIELNRRKITSGALLLFGFSIVAAGFAGHLQLFVVMLTCILFYLLFRLRKIAYASCYLAILLLSLGIGSIQHVPTLELLSQSARSNHPYDYLINTLLIQPVQLIKIISPDIFGNPAVGNYLPNDSYPSKALYIGLLPFLLALGGLIFSRNNPFVRFFTLFGLGLLGFMLRTPLTELLYRSPVPLLSSSSPTNALFLLSFWLAVLAGFGYDAFKKNSSMTIRIPIVVTWIIILFVWAGEGLDIIQIQKNNLIYTTILLTVSSGVIFFFHKIQKIRFAAFIFLLITILDLFYFFNKFNPFISTALVFPDTPVLSWLNKNAGINRFWGYGNAAVEANFATQYHIFSPDGYDPLYPKRYGEIINTGDDGKITKRFNNQTRSDARIAPGYGETDLPSNTNRLKLLQLLGVRYILDRNENGSTQNTFPSSLFSESMRIDQWQIFEYKNALPRTFLASHTLTYASAGEFERIFFNTEFDPKKTILLEEHPGQSLSAETPDGEANILDYQPNQVTIKTTTTGTKLLFLSDTYFPGWVATIDQTPAKIYRAFWSFRAVVVPAGSHTVVFSYQPQSFLLGTKMTIISIMLFALAITVLPKLIKRYEK